MLQALPVLLIMLLASWWRFHKLAEIPATLNRDEAALAYNAYLLMETGKDEWERRWPLALESFGDYKLPGYPLLLIPSFAVFGLSDFAVRVPAAVAGVLLIGVGYLFARGALRLGHWYALAVAGIVAIQPVFIFYSRMAWEANVGLLFFTTAATLLLSTITPQRLRLVGDVSALVFLLLAIFTYNTPLILIPFLAVSVLIQRGWKTWRHSLLGLAGMAVIFAIGMASLASISQQKSAITIFSDETYWQESVNYYQSFSGISQKLFGNRFVFFGRAMVQNFIASWSPNFLIEEGGEHPWHNLPGHGHLLIGVYFLALVGVGQALRHALSRCSAEDQRRYQALILLLLTALAPAIITVDAPHATRSLFFFFLLCCLAGLGIRFIAQIVEERSTNGANMRVLVAVLLLIGLTIEARNYSFAYFSQYRAQSRVILRAGLEDLVKTIEKQYEGTKTQVAIVDPDGYMYTHVAWMLRMSPEEFFGTIDRHLPDRIGFKYGYKVGRYRFIAHREDRLPEDTRMLEWNSDIDQWIVQ